MTKIENCLLIILFHFPIEVNLYGRSVLMSLSFFFLFLPSILRIIKTEALQAHRLERFLKRDVLFHAVSLETEKVASFMPAGFGQYK